MEPQPKQVDDGVPVMGVLIKDWQPAPPRSQCTNRRVVGVHPLKINILSVGRAVPPYGRTDRPRRSCGPRTHAHARARRGGGGGGGGGGRGGRGGRARARGK